jgi:hypothetical protein
VLGDNHGDARIQQSLLCVEHVERRALSGQRLIADAFQCALGGVVLPLRRLDLRLRRLQLAPGLDDVGLRLVAH